MVGADATSGLTLPNLLNVASAYGLATAQISSSANLREQIRDILNVYDVARLVMKQIQKFDKIHNIIFCVGGGEKNSISLKLLTKKKNY